MKNNLFSRFALIIALILLAVFCVYSHGLKGGIDLSGGTDLIYQLNVPKGYQGSPARLAQRVISTLKRRVDPQGVHNLIWRVVGMNRIEIQMPLASAKARAARDAFNKAQRQLAAANLEPSQIATAMAQPPAQRNKDIAALSIGDKKRSMLLNRLAQAYAQRAAALKVADKYKADPTKMPEADIARLNAATSRYTRLRRAVLATNVNVARAVRLLKSNVYGDNAKAAKRYAAMIQSHSAQAAYLNNLRNAYREVRKHRGGLDDPAELQRMLRGAGVLDFRIAYETRPHVTEAEQAIQQLMTQGPRRAHTPPGTQWFRVGRGSRKSFATDGGIAVGMWKHREYVLLYTTPQRALTHGNGRADWKLTQAYPGTDPNNGGTLVNFYLDPVGGSYMGQLTGKNIGHPMVILLDNKAINSATIQSTITTSGDITFGSAQSASGARRIGKQADDLVRILDAGSLPATLQQQPISVRTIGPTLGADNLRAGLHSAVIAVIAVMGFMLIYYTITGAFADIALMINLILLLGSMALLNATFTLPGIAGVVLTLGMAVDANVLINERIREELHRGATLWMAVKQGYDKVFWTIFDANLTTSLTSIVLIFVASEEVKGFGVTLLIGLCIHMFTALFVTRTLMMAAIRTGVMRRIDDISITEYLRDIFTFTWLKGRWPFMRVVTVTNFDWIGKRYIFWAVSAFVMVAGVVAFVARGKHKYDTEFNGGTEVTLHLKRGATMPISKVRKRVAAIAGRVPELRGLKRATVEAVGRKHNQFEIVTTVVNPPLKPGVKVDVSRLPVTLLQTSLETAFHDVLHWTPALSFAHVHVPSANVQALLRDRTIIPVTRGNLQALVPNAPNVDINAYKGGVAIRLRDIKPPVPVAQLQHRIASMREEPDFSAVAYRRFTVVPVRYAPGPVVAPAKRLVTDAVMVSVDSADVYDSAHPSRNRHWDTHVAASEWKIARAALTASSGLAGVSSFAPQVANAAKIKALAAVLISLVLIVAYVWIRFGGIRYGFGAIFSLVHDAIVAVAATVLSVYIARTFIGKFLLVEDFRINLTMIAAYLTIIGYSVNDTIVIFDRIRENRGRSKAPLTAKLVNDSINQCFGRTVWTTFTVFIVVLILYVFGGEGVHGFAYAMLIGVFTGAYSTLAIASPMLLHVKEKELPPSDAPKLGELMAANEVSSAT